MKNYICGIIDQCTMQKIITIISVCFLFLFTSCIPTQDLIYLRKKDDKEVISPVNQLPMKAYRVQTSDILMIGIKTSDQKLGDMFKSATTEGNNNQAISEQNLYFNGYSVDDHGNIRIPIIGELNVLGFTLEEIRIKLEKLLLEEYFKKEANLFVTVKLSGVKFTVNGEVNSPGTKSLYQDRVNILEAIASAGDITVTGDRKKVTVMRQYPHGIELHDIDLTNITALNSPYFYLQPSDYIYVKPLKQKTWGTGKTGIESLSTLITLLSLATTTYLLLKK